MITTSLNVTNFGYQENISAFRYVPDEVTYIILKNLDLQNVHAFTTTNHQALTFRKILWFDFAKEFGYTGDLANSHEYLRSFFSKIAEIANSSFFPEEWKVHIKVKFSQEMTTKSQVSGYLTSLNVLKAKSEELNSILKLKSVYHSPELLFLIQKASGIYFKQIINKTFVKTELLNPACRDGNIKNIRIYCDWVDNPNLNNNQLAPIHEAARAGQGMAIRVLCEYGASVDAIWRETERRTRLIRGRGRGTQTQSYTVTHNRTPLELAFYYKSEDAVAALLEAKAYPKDLFIRACSFSNYHMLTIFLKLASCELNEGLVYCFVNRNIPQYSLPCFKLLLTHGANPNIVDNKGKSLLYLSVESGSLDFIRLLHDFGADLEMRSNKGKSPLYVAIKEKIAKVKRVEMVSLLCELGADINALGPNGKKTMLEHAKKNKKIFELLNHYIAIRSLSKTHQG